MCQDCVELIREILPNEALIRAFCDENGHWAIRGIVDVNENLFPMSHDTKVVSKVLEMQIETHLRDQCEERGWAIFPARSQNEYPDFSIRIGDRALIALDIKSTYRHPLNPQTSLQSIRYDYGKTNEEIKSIADELGIVYTKANALCISRDDANRIIAHIEENDGQRLELGFQGSSRRIVIGYMTTQKISTMTLGTYQGYFRPNEEDDDDESSIRFPYADYCEHLCLCVLYDRADEEDGMFRLDDLANIQPVIRNLEFHIQPKWAIADRIPGSGNTKNIGAMSYLELIREGRGRFQSKEHFEWYWRQYSSTSKNNEDEWPGFG